MSIVTCQNLINSGMAWKLEGHIGRTCMAAIQDGACMLGPDTAVDYWGNFIPSRSMVKTGTPGSRQFVVDTHGEDHALELELVPCEPMIEALISQED